ncbi:phosphoribosyl transferase [Candidatus Uhrbacteria bacterium]|nr:phosphoribosyl transferase [Candidatus Uhrbacteria bacterium]
MVFEDRQDAGKKLAVALAGYKGKPDILLYALPRGGAVLGAEIAKALDLPFDVVVTRKVGAPFNPEYAIGALAETGEVVWNEAEREATDKKALEKIVKAEKAEAVRRVKKYRKGRELPDMEGKTVILIDDGVATGLTIRAGVAALKNRHPGKIVVAVPHGAKESMDALREGVDEVVVLHEPEWYGAVGEFYKDFPQTSDEEVLKLLDSQRTFDELKTTD